MRRAGILVIYAYDGRLGRYRRELLKELAGVLDSIWIVINGLLEDAEIRELRENYTDQVYVRENRGFDAEAYGDVLQNYCTVDVLKEYDELVFCNDTFFGPFVPFNYMFQCMNNNQSDFWGIDRIDRGFLSYVIMYFCVFRKRVFCEGGLHKYFEENICDKTETIADAFARFEVGLTYYLKRNGFTMDSFVYSKGIKPMFNPDICIIEKGLPILKKKFFKKECFNVVKYNRTMEYLQAHSEYDLSIIKEEMQGLLNPGGINEICMDHNGAIVSELYDIPIITEEDICKFIFNNRQRGLYVWGNGSFGKATVFLFLNNNSGFRGYIESTPKNKTSTDGYPIYSPQEVPNEAAIIFALNKNNTKEVVENNVRFKTILTFWEAER